MWGNADAMLAAVGGTECEFALAGASLRNDTVIVVECLLHCDENADVWLGQVVLRGIVPGFSVIMACVC